MVLQTDSIELYNSGSTLINPLGFALRTPFESNARTTAHGMFCVSRLDGRDVIYEEGPRRAHEDLGGGIDREVLLPCYCLLYCCCL